MAYFFFGTLMDRDVLATVLGRAVADDEMIPAWLHDFRRVHALAECYPVLVRSPGLVVGGVVFQPRDVRDDTRIRHFEGDEYVERWAIVHLGRGRRLASRVFFGLEVLEPTEEPWDLEVWREAHKAAFLEDCRDWMSDCGGGDSGPERSTWAIGCRP